MFMSPFALLAVACLGIYLIVGTYALEGGIAFALKWACSSGDPALKAVAYNRSFAMRAAMLAIVLTWPIVVIVAVIAASRRQRAFYRLQ